MTESFHYLPYKDLVAKYLANGGDRENADLIREYLAELSGTRGIAESTRDTLTRRLLVCVLTPYNLLYPLFQNWFNVV